MRSPISLFCCSLATFCILSLNAVAADEVKEIAPKVKINPVDGAEMLWVPSGEFLMGSDEAVEEPLSETIDKKSDHSPQRKVFLDGYWIYKNEVTVGQFKKFERATNSKEGVVSNHNETFAPYGKTKDSDPIMELSWDAAVAYCKWAKVRLPTEAEWEKAARGTDGRWFPWGNEFDLDFKDVSPLGCLDMAGGANEWCADWYEEDYYNKAPLRNPKGPSKSRLTHRVVRGGSFLVQVSFQKSHFFSTVRREHYDPVHPRAPMSLGFRCAAN